MFSALGYCRTLDRSLEQLRDIFRSTYYEFFELFTITSYHQPEHRLTTAIPARQRVICDYINAHELQKMQTPKNPFGYLPGTLQN